MAFERRALLLCSVHTNSRDKVSRRPLLDPSSSSSASSSSSLSALIRTGDSQCVQSTALAAPRRLFPRPARHYDSSPIKRTRQARRAARPYRDKGNGQAGAMENRRRSWLPSSVGRTRSAESTGATNSPPFSSLPPLPPQLQLRAPPDDLLAVVERLLTLDRPKGQRGDRRLRRFVPLALPSPLAQLARLCAVSLRSRGRSNQSTGGD